MIKQLTYVRAPMLTGMRYRVVSMAGVAALTVAAVLIASHPPIQELLGAVTPAGGLQPVPLMPGERTFAAVVAAVGMTAAFVGLSHPRPWRAEALVSRSSKTCSACGTEDGSQRVERGLYVCDECGVVANADVNGAENIRQKVLPNLV
jgi:ribosomal protein L37AE/L43A